jgi:hypothetical protein
MPEMADLTRISFSGSMVLVIFVFPLEYEKNDSDDQNSQKCE